MNWKADPNLHSPGIRLPPCSSKQGEFLTVKELCLRSGIPYRVSGGQMQWVVLDSSTDQHFRGVNDRGESVHVVGAKELPEMDPARSVRILEILAYAFHDWASRECVCGRGIFV